MQLLDGKALSQTIKEEIKNLGVQEAQAEGPVFQIQSRLESLNDQFSTTCMKIDSVINLG